MSTVLVEESWKRLSEAIFGPALMRRPPDRVVRAIRRQEENSEILVGWMQIAAIIFFAIFYSLAPKAFASDVRFAPVPVTLGACTLFTALRLVLAYRGALRTWFLTISVLIDIVVLMVTIWSCHLQYGGWIERPGNRVFNLYLPPIITPTSGSVEPWLAHVKRVYPGEADHILKWLAHRVQKPNEKINHALVLGGAQGIGKDTILEPLKHAVGPWNFTEVSPQQVLRRFNGFVKSVILRVSEARDLGEVDRFSFYDHMKSYIAAPPDVLRVDEKHIREYSVINVCGVVITTNHKTDGIYLPADDRRHYVAWSHLTRDDFPNEYWKDLYRWYEVDGTQHVTHFSGQTRFGRL